MLLAQAVLQITAAVMETVAPGKPGDCAGCRVALQAVESDGGQVIAWQCPICHRVSASRMPPLPRGATECPVCRRQFTSVRRHWAQQKAYGDGECERFYREGMIWTKERPAWARAAET